MSPKNHGNFPLNNHNKRKKRIQIGQTIRKPDGDLTEIDIEWNPQEIRWQDRPTHGDTSKREGGASTKKK